MRDWSGARQQKWVVKQRHAPQLLKVQKEEKEDTPSVACRPLTRFLHFPRALP